MPCYDHVASPKGRDTALLLMKGQNISRVVDVRCCGRVPTVAAADGDVMMMMPLWEGEAVASHALAQRHLINRRRGSSFQ